MPGAYALHTKVYGSTYARLQVRLELGRRMVGVTRQPTQEVRSHEYIQAARRDDGRGRARRGRRRLRHRRRGRGAQLLEHRRRHDDALDNNTAIDDAHDIHAHHSLNAVADAEIWLAAQIRRAR
jgi:hypothetical protein